jgi:hypothetical protein
VVLLGRSQVHVGMASPRAYDESHAVNERDLFCLTQQLRALKREVLRDQSRRCGVSAARTEAPQLAAAPQKAYSRQAATESIARKGWMRSTDVSHPCTYWGAMWRRGHKKRGARAGDAGRLRFFCLDSGLRISCFK